MNEALYINKPFSKLNGFPKGMEGPGTDQEGNVYAVNYQRLHTIGKVTPDGEESVFLELPEESIANGIRFNQAGDMLIADYTGHNILKVNMKTKQLSVFAHEPQMNQPNDIAITDDDFIYASDPNWKAGTGQLWRIDPNGQTTLLEENMGTTNGIEVSPDNRTLYVNESRSRKVWAYDIEADKSLSHKRLFIEFPEFGLDGMRCDIKGNLYITRSTGAIIAVLSPEGKVLREIKLDGEKCSNLTFGGPDGRTLYITMPKEGRFEYFRTEYPGRCWAMYRT